MTPFSFGFTVEAMVTVRLPLVASETVTVVPSPPSKLTSLPGLTMPFEVLPSEIFQPLALIASATALLVVKPVASVVLAAPVLVSTDTSPVVALTVWISVPFLVSFDTEIKLSPLTSMASRAASLTVFLDTPTKYLAFLSPVDLLSATVIVAMLVSPVNVAASTDSVEILAFNCLRFTASVSFTPSATLVIVLPPLFKPLAVKVTGDLPSSLAAMVTPPSVIVVPPIVNEPSLVKSTVLFKAKVKFVPSRFTRRFLPAFKPRVSPAFIAADWLAVSSALVSSSDTSASLSLPAFAYQVALLTAFTTVSTVASLPESVFDGSSGFL